MYRLGLIEESIDNRDILNILAPYFIAQRIENVLEDEYPVWHINEYQVSDNQIENIVEILKQHIKATWYSHAFSDKSLFVILSKKWFEISLKRDETWDEMIKYGINNAKVERCYLESIPLHI